VVLIAHRYRVIGTPVVAGARGRNARRVHVTGQLRTLLEAVQRLPAVRVEVEDGRGSAHVRVGARPIASIDLDRSQVLVHVDADRIPPVRRVFPSARETAEGIVFDVAGPRDSAQALAAIRRRADVETFGAQSRAASP
jgi:hypothetical protein